MFPEGIDKYRVLVVQPGKCGGGLAIQTGVVIHKPVNNGWLRAHSSYPYVDHNTYVA
ncbi:hypothetical protein E5AUHO_06880 [Citrobacter freundii]|nr:hypothetical protein E5AUHO_06880 [Citrobacter freundii]